MSFVGFCGNLTLVIIKLVGGTIGNSSALISDGIHSLSDLITTIVTFLGAAAGGKKADKKHPYGHDRFESIAQLFLTIVLFSAAFILAKDGIQSIFTGSYLENDAANITALVIAALAIFIKEFMFVYILRIAKKINSSLYIAEAWHNQTDALSSFGALIGIVGSMLGIKILDPIASIFISLLIFRLAIHVLVDSLEQLLDTSCGEDFEKNVSDLILSNEAIDSIYKLKTRQAGDKKFVDVKVCVNKDLNVAEAHRISREVHDTVEDHFKDIKHIMVLVKPTDD